MNEKELFDSLFPVIYKYFYYKQVSKEEIDDLAQDTFLRYFSKYVCANLAEEESRKIIFGIAKNVYREWVREMRKRYVSLDFDIAEPDEVAWYDFFGDCEIDYSDDVLQADVNKALEALPERLSYILRARYIDGKTRAEVAGELGIVEKHVHVYQRRGLVMLKKELLKSDLYPSLHVPSKRQI